MPQGDGTGPAGLGPATGRGAGYCAGMDQPGNISAGYGFGQGRARRNAWSRGCGGGIGRRGFIAAGSNASAPGGGWINQLIEILAAFRHEGDSGQQRTGEKPGDIQEQLDDLKRRIDEQVGEQ